MSDQNKKSFDIEVIAEGRIFHPWQVGRASMWVDGTGALLAYSPGGAGRRLPDRADLRHLTSRGIIRILPVVDFADEAAGRSIRSVRVISTAPSMTNHSSTKPADVSAPAEPHGPPSPAEMADEVAAELAFQPIAHTAMSVRSAYVLYLEAMADLNDRLGRHAVEPLCDRGFDRRVAVARFLAADAVEAGMGVTIH